MDQRIYMYFLILVIFNICIDAFYLPSSSVLKFSVRSRRDCYRFKNSRVSIPINSEVSLHRTRSMLHMSLTAGTSEGTLQSKSLLTRIEEAASSIMNSLKNDAEIAITEIEGDAESALLEFEKDGDAAINIISEAVLPSNANDLLSIFVADIGAGVFSAYASRLVALLLGDRKRDNVITKGTITATYFGVRGVAREVALLSGLPRPIANVIGGLVASLLSESAKVASRTQEKSGSTSLLGSQPGPTKMQDDYNSTQTLLDLLSNPISEVQEVSSAVQVKRKMKKEKLITFPEILQDISKWIVYDFLGNYDIDNIGPQRALLYGLIAGLSSHGLFELLTLGRKVYKLDGVVYTITSTPKEVISRFTKSGLEASVLFGSYSFCEDGFSNLSLPPEVKKFLSTDFDVYFRNLITLSNEISSSLINT